MTLAATNPQKSKNAKKNTEHDRQTFFHRTFLACIADLQKTMRGQGKRAVLPYAGYILSVAQYMFYDITYPQNKLLYEISIKPILSALRMDPSILLISF